MQIICGDMNAQVSSADSKGFTFGNRINRNGLYLLNTTFECDLIACNTSFQTAKEKLWTFTYPNKSQAQLDYILVNNKWRNSVKDCQAYNSFGSLNSDHQIVSTKMQLSLRSNKKVKAKSNPHDWQLFKSQERLNQWKDHFSNLLGQPPPDNYNTVRKMVQKTLPIKTSKFTIAELKVAVTSLSNNKCPGVDGIPAEL